jgi:hypothetical protein
VKLKMKWKKDKTWKMKGGNHESWINSRNEILLVSKEGKKGFVTKERGYDVPVTLGVYKTKKEAMERAEELVKSSKISMYQN